MADYELRAERREQTGKNKVDKLRYAGIVPGVIYHKSQEAENVQVNELEFNKVYTQAGNSALVALDLGDRTATVLIKEVQRHPVKRNALHIDFQEVKADEKVRLTVPVVLLNRDSIRVQPSVLLQLLDEVEVECFPADIPHTAEIDVEDMQIGDVVTVQDLDIAKNDKITILVPAEEPVASLNEPQEEHVEEEAEEMEASEVPEVGKEESDEDNSDAE